MKMLYLYVVKAFFLALSGADFCVGYHVRILKQPGVQLFLYSFNCYKKSRLRILIIITLWFVTTYEKYVAILLLFAAVIL